MMFRGIEIPNIHLPLRNLSEVPISKKNLGKGYSDLLGIRQSTLGLISFLTGCFDVKLHGGHQVHLQQARGYAPEGILVVGLNSDESVRQLKGPHRPIDNEQKRLARLVETSWVDYAFIFDDENAIPALMSLSPDIYVTFYEKLFGKKEIEYIAEGMPETVIRINTYYEKDKSGKRVSTSSVLAMNGER